MFSHKVNGRIFFVLALIFIMTLGVMIYITQHRTSDIVNQLSLDRTQAAKQGLITYLDELSQRAFLRGELIANQEKLIDAMNEYYNRFDAFPEEEFENRLTEENYDIIKKILDNFISGYDFVSVCDVNGVALARSDSGEREYPLLKNGYNLGANPDVAQVLKTGEGITTISFMLDNSTFIVGAAYPIHYGDELIGAVTCFYDLTNPKYLQTFKEQTGCEATIFVGHEQFISTFKDENGDVLQIKADEEIIDAIFEDRVEAFISFTNILDITYGVHYSPLVYYGEVVGILLTGVDVSGAVESRSEMSFLIILIALLSSLISIALVFASNKYSRALDRRLMQQSLMRQVSQRFLSEEDVETLITSTLQKIGTFMGVSQILLFKAKEGKPTEFECTNEWRAHKYSELPSRLGIDFDIRGPLLNILLRLRNKEKFFISSDEPQSREAMKPYRLHFYNYFVATIFVGDKLYAVLDFSRENNAGKWNKDDINMASFVSNILSSALNKQYMENQLISAKEQAEQSNRYKGIFLAHMSHEIRTPMNAILGISEIQLANKSHREETIEAFTKINESGNLLINIINDILDFSKIEAGKVETKSIEYDIPTLISDTVLINTSRYENSNIEFMLDLREGTPLELFGDALRIKQILNNLLSNAFKYTEKGVVTLSIFSEPIPKLEGCYILIFRVTDTGLGMNQSQVSRIFNEYTRFNMNTNRSISGTGLGMSITKRLIDMMEGEIFVSSEVNKGSEFTVRIPQKAVGDIFCTAELANRINQFDFEDMSRLSKTKIAQEATLNGRVLVVDDVSSNLYVASGMLELYGLQVETATSGFEVIDKIKKGESYDIIFMDHMMPIKDGTQTTKELRSMGYTAPIVALTANAVIGQAEVFLSNGFDEFVPKPIDVKQLNEILDKFIVSDKPAPVVAPSKQIDPMLLQAFCRDIENAILVLREAEDLKKFATTAHGIKTVLANMGEVHKSEKAFEFEKAGLDGDSEFISRNIDSFIEMLETLLLKITPTGTPASDNDDIIEDTDFLKEHLTVIKTACENYDSTTAYDAYSLIKTKQWKSSTTLMLEEIHDLMFLSSEFEEAGNKLEAFLSSQ
jgi:signal transduction histidine kinase/CheY-like chemotaxis protein